MTKYLNLEFHWLNTSETLWDSLFDAGSGENWNEILYSSHKEERNPGSACFEHLCATWNPLL